MKSVLKVFSFASLMLFAACDKIDTLTHYDQPTAAVMLSSSATTIAAAAADSLKNAVTFSWNNPGYPLDSSKVKYVLEIDSAGRNFSKAITRTVSGALNTTLTAKELNTILLGFGFAFNTPYSIDARVSSSYPNNNQQIKSNTIKLTATPYKIPPKVALPASGRLFIVGDASEFDWTNNAAPPFPPKREFTRLSETQWGGIFKMTGSGGYKILEIQGNWDIQYHMIAGGDALSGSFIFQNADPTFPSPAVGFYKIILDFQTGKYSLTKVDNAVPTELYMVGDAVVPNWVNNPPASLKFAALTNGLFEITLPFVPGKQYKFLSSFGNWQPQFGGSSATGGNLGANYGGGSDPSGIPTPAEAGNYKIQVNFVTNTYTVTKL